MRNPSEKEKQKLASLNSANELIISERERGRTSRHFFVNADKNKEKLLKTSLIST